MSKTTLTELEMFQLSSHVLDATAIVEKVVIEAFSVAPPKVVDYLIDVISTNIPNTLMVEDELVELWNTARNRDQIIIDWFMATYRLVSLTAGKEAILDHVRESYANSIFIGDVEELYGDDDLGSRLSKNANDVTNLLKKHKWSIIILALFSIDLSEFEAEYNETRPTKASD